MCAALAHPDALDGRPADPAGLLGALVHKEVILEITAAVDPIDAGPMMVNTCLQYFTDILQKIGSLLQR